MAVAFAVVQSFSLATFSGDVRADDGYQDISATSYRSTRRAQDDRIDAALSAPRETPTVMAIRRASPAVVNLHGQKTVRGTTSLNVGNVADVKRQVNGMGTGVIIDPRGYVITNHHVIEDVREIQVTLFDGRTTQAELVASDPANDLALVRVQSNEDLPPMPRGRSDDLMVGETVIAIGNAYGYVHTSTLGIISALHRDVPVNENQGYHDLIQTSAGINPGNSGGPLLNINGEIIGINVAVRVEAQQIAFAIPIDQVLETVTNMIQKHNDRRLVVGMAGSTDPDGGLRVTRLVSGGSAEASGLQAGDRVTRINQSTVKGRLPFALAMLDVQPGQSVAVEFDRNGQFYQTQMETGSSSGGSGTVASLAWQVIGVSFEPIDEASVSRLNGRMRTSYRGGLSVTGVRPGSAADEQGISVGDVLLGINSWQTASATDLLSILEHEDIRRGQKAKFFLIRRDQTLYGHMQLANRQARTARR